MENRINHGKYGRENSGQTNDPDDINDESKSPRQEDIKNYRYPLENEADMDVDDDDERLNNHFGKNNPSI